MHLNISDTFNTELPADKLISNERRQVNGACFSFVEPKKTKEPQLIHSAIEVAQLLGLSEDDLQSESFLKVFTGNKILPDTKPYAMCYGGHQFGNWAGQLGDGRAINLAEVVFDHKRWALQIKGSGLTPYSRTADGLAVLRSSVREYLCSEAMYHLGVPTTRALSLALSGDEVLRDPLYDGNAAYEKGAIVCRVAPSFLRFGNYEMCSARNEKNTLQTLLDYTIKHFYADLPVGQKTSYISVFRDVAIKTLDMIIHWQRVGFVHGVMNTDNMSMLGLTIDYGPYGWLEGYDHNWTPNTTDNQHKRYRYGNQVNIGLWNLMKLANAIYPLIEEAEPFEKILDEYKERFAKNYLSMMKAKLGLEKNDKNDTDLIGQLESNLQTSETDMTIFFRKLSLYTKESKASIELVKDAFYKPEEVKGSLEGTWNEWIARYIKRLQKEVISDDERMRKMNSVNPKYVLRNYMAQLAIDDADKGEYKLIDDLYQLLKKPYDDQSENEHWFAKRQEWARSKVGCSMLSCSS